MIGALSLLALATAAPDFGSLKTYSDWIVGCDNWRRCHATSLDAENGADDAVTRSNLGISVKREADPNAEPTVHLGLLDEINDSVIASIQIDGRKTNSSFRVDGESVQLDGQDAVRLITAMRRGRRIGLVDAGGKELGAASLKGLTAALIYIDDRQFRGGTRTALARSGAKPADAKNIPPIPEQPVVYVGPVPKEVPQTLPDEAVAKLRVNDPCNAQSAILSAPPVKYHRLDDKHTLLVIPSRCAGYNAPNQLFLIDAAGNARPAPFTANPLLGKGGIGLPNVSWNAATRTLLAYRKGRGVGDCGDEASYAWEYVGRFHLVHLASMTECRGSNRFITTYRLDVRPVPLVPNAAKP